MKAALILTVLAGGMCWGQAADDCKPSSLNIPGAPYPCVYPDRRVAFRVAAPDAQKVQVRLGGVHEMTRGTDGLWTVTIPPQVVGFHYYSIVVDGAVMADPAHENLFRLRMGQQRNRDSRARCGFLRRQGRAARTGEPALVLLEGHRAVASLLCLHTAGL